MRQVEIVTGKCSILVITLPERTVPNGNNHDEYIGLDYMDYSLGKLTVLPSKYKHDVTGDWQHLGKATELTEEDWEGIVDSDRRGFKHYWNDNGFVPRGFNHRYKTATKSGISLLKANGVLLDQKCYNPMCDKGIIHYSFGDQEDCDSCKELESKVWRNFHVFIKQK